MNISTRRAMWLGLVVLSMVLAGGCTIRSAAETILTIRLDDPDGMGLDSDGIVIGLGNVLWRGERDNYEIIGHGNHPRAHESYWLLEAEGPVALVDRFIYIEPDGPAEEWPDYRMELAIDARSLSDDPDTDSRMLVFTGTLPPPHKAFPDRQQFSLNQIPFTSPGGPIRTIFVSGDVVAKSVSQAEFKELLRTYELRLSNRR